MRFALAAISFFFVCSAFAAEFHFHRGMSYYEFLGAPETAGAAEIKSAYRKTMMKMHEDRGGSKEDAQFANEAYEVLKDESLREAFDEWLRYTRPRPPVAAASSGAGACEAILRYREAAELGEEEILPSFDIRL